MAKEKKEFEVVELMGIFWTVFGVVVLCAMYWVRVPPALKDQMNLTMARIVDAIAGGLLLIIGLACIFKGRTNKRKRLQ